MVHELTDSTFDASIKSGNVVVDFWAPWCGPCKQMGPEYDAASKEVKSTFHKLNVDEHQESAGKFGIRGIPTVIFFKDGKEVHRFSGARDKASILAEEKKAFG